MLHVRTPHSSGDPWAAATRFSSPGWKTALKTDGTFAVFALFTYVQLEQRRPVGASTASLSYRATYSSPSLHPSDLTYATWKLVVQQEACLSLLCSFQYCFLFCLSKTPFPTLPLPSRGEVTCLFVSGTLPILILMAHLGIFQSP